MKKLLISVSLFLSMMTVSKAQSQSLSTDSLTKRVERIELHLNKSHREFRTGNVIFITGAALTLLSFFAPDDSRDKALLLGGSIALIGGIIMIDSHKHLRIK